MQIVKMTTFVFKYISDKRWTLELGLDDFPKDFITALMQPATTYGVLSSAQLAIFTYFKMKNKSTKKMLNDNGSSIEPCGTSKIIYNQEL